MSPVARQHNWVHAYREVTGKRTSLTLDENHHFRKKFRGRCEIESHRSNDDIHARCFRQKGIHIYL